MRRADFNITPKGDLVFVESNKLKERFTIEFYVAKEKALRVDFSVRNLDDRKINNETLAIRFNYSSINYNKRANVITDSNYEAQEALIKLKTPKGEISKRPQLGSGLESVMHRNIYDSKVLNSVESKTAEALGRSIEGYNIKASPKVDKNETYKQTVNVRIYKDNKTLLDYELE